MNSHILKQSDIGVTFEMPKEEEVIASTPSKPKKIEILAKLEDQLKEIKASIDCCSPVLETASEGEDSEEEDGEDEGCCCSDKCDYLLNELTYIYRSLSDIREALWQHANSGHLPKIPSISKLKEILSILKLDDEYDVQPQVIYASDGKKTESILIKTK
jgi:hypothetical protein